MRMKVGLGGVEWAEEDMEGLDRMLVLFCFCQNMYAEAIHLGPWIERFLSCYHHITVKY